MEAEALEAATNSDGTSVGMWVLLCFVVGLVGAFLGAYLQRLRARAGGRPIYWNLILFALIGACFSTLAMNVVEAQDRVGIALLFIGLISGYATSIKELDLAKIEIEKLELQLEANRAGTTKEPPKPTEASSGIKAKSSTETVPSTETDKGT